MIVNVLRVLFVATALLAIAALIAGNLTAFSMLLGATMGVMISLSKAAARRDDAARIAEQAK